MNTFKVTLNVTTQYVHELPFESREECEKFLSGADHLSLATEAAFKAVDIHYHIDESTSGAEPSIEATEGGSVEETTIVS